MFHTKRVELFIYFLEALIVTGESTKVIKNIDSFDQY